MQISNTVSDLLALPEATPQALSNTPPLQDSEGTLDAISVPGFVVTTKSRPETITEEVFMKRLEDAKIAYDPFTTLAENCHLMDNTSRCIITLNSGAVVELTLSNDPWSSTAFKCVQPGLFRYITLQEHDVATETTKPLELHVVRMSNDHKEGEWLHINKGDTISGKSMKDIAEKISLTMRITECLLVDAAKVKSSDGRDIHIRIPLQIMHGHGYYGPLFTLAPISNSPSAIEIGTSGKFLRFNQDPKKHANDLKWMQTLALSSIHDEVLAKKAHLKKALGAITQRAYPVQSVEDRMKTTFQDFLKNLYAKKASSPKATEDYEWTMFNLLCYFNKPADNPTAKKYNKVMQALDNNMLMWTSFSK